MNKTAMAITVVITAFVLVMVAGVFFGVRTARAVLAASAPTPVATEVAVTNQPIEQQIQQAVQQRDQAYQDLLNQANARLDSLQKENQALKEQLQATQNNTTANNTQSNSQASITPQEAAQVAAFWMGDNQVYSVEAVNVRNMPLYKVTFSSGAAAYVSLDGQVVGTQAPSAFDQPIQQGNGGESEHESGGDND